MTENNFPHRKNLIGRIDEQPFRPRTKDFLNLLCESKIIFLNKENLTELEGYKANLKLKGLLEHSEIHIVLTGFSQKAAKCLYDKLRALPKNEIYSDNLSIYQNNPEET